MKKYLLILPLVLMPVSTALASNAPNRDARQVQSRLSGINGASLQDRIIASISPEPTYHAESNLAELQPRVGSKESEKSLQERIAGAIARNYQYYSGFYPESDIRSDHVIDLQDAIAKSILGR